MQINTAERLLEALNVLEQNLSNYKQAIGATDDEITLVGQYRANLAQAIENDILIEHDKQSSTGIKNAVYKGNPQVPVTKYPSFAVEPLPFPDLPGGAEIFYRELKRRYKTAKGYTKVIGVALGFEAIESNKIPFDSLVGAANLKNLSGYEYQADFKKKGANGMAFQHRISGTEKWFDAKTAFSSPVIIKVEKPAVEGAAVQIEVRCRPLKGNELIGQWSPIYSLTVSP